MFREVKFRSAIFFTKTSGLVVKTCNEFKCRCDCFSALGGDGGPHRRVEVHSDEQHQPRGLHPGQERPRRDPQGLCHPVLQEEVHRLPRADRCVCAETYWYHQHEIV